MKNVTFLKSIEGYTLYANARRLSPRTIADYTITFKKLAAYLGADPPIADITADTIRQFFAAQTVSKKTILNYHAGLSALWQWAAAEGLVATNIIHQVAAPKPEIRAVEPFSEADVKAMLAVLDRSRVYTRPGKSESDHAIVTGLRNRAIILQLLDTGMRADEICELRIHQVDLKNHRIKVFGKGAKERIVPISPRTSQAIWKYLATRPDDLANEYLYVTKSGGRIDRTALYHLIEHIGERAGVPNAHPHRFRHTFAIQFIRAGGNVFSLQMILGHTTMGMVRKYLAIAQADLEASHKIASPVSNWRL